MALPPYPFVARLTSFDTRAGTGRLTLVDGTTLACGATSFRRRRADSRWLPTVGAEYRVLDGKTLPVVGPRATEVLELDEPLERPVVDDPPSMPTGSIHEALAWLEQRGERVTRAPRGASEEEIDEVRRALGVPLPPTWVDHLREFHWIETRLVSTLRLTGERGVLAMRERMKRRVEQTVAIPNVATEQARALRELATWPPIVEAGNPIPFGSALCIDVAGDLRWVHPKELLDPEAWSAPQTKPFSRIVLDELASWYDPFTA